MPIGNDRLAADSLTGPEKQLLKTAYEQVEDEEDEHLYHSAGWARELHLQALGLPAQLPPAEERRDVRDATQAAQVKKERKAALASQKGVRGEEEKSSRRFPKARFQRQQTKKTKPTICCVTRKTLSGNF
jgi:hypothetical protein